MVVLSEEQASEWPIPVTPLPPEGAHATEQQRAQRAQDSSQRPKVHPDHVLYADRWLMVVNKPAGIYCEDVLLESAVCKRAAIYSQERDASGTEKQASASTVRAAHRLDRDTSGAMVLVLHADASAPLTQMFTEGSVEKVC